MIKRIGHLCDLDDADYEALCKDLASMQEGSWVQCLVCGEITLYPEGDTTAPYVCEECSDADEHPVYEAAEYNYRTVATCDGCGKEREGLMMHAEGATGRVCPVLFLCDECRGGGQ